MRFIRLRKFMFFRFEKHFFHVALILSLFFIHATFMDIALSYSYYRYINRDYFIEYEVNRYVVECFESGIFPINYIIYMIFTIMFFIVVLYILKFLILKIGEHHIRKTKSLVELAQFFCVGYIMFNIIRRYSAGLTWYDGDTFIVSLLYHSFDSIADLLIYAVIILLIISLIPLVMKYFADKKVDECIAVWFSNLDGENE